MFPKYAVFLIPFFWASICIAQGQEFSGEIRDSSGHSIIGARVLIKELKKGARSNSKGLFIIKSVTKGHYTLQITANAYDSLQVSVDLPSVESHNIFILKERTITAGEVVVTESSIGELKRIEPIKADVIDFRITKQEASNVSQVMNRTAGIKMRSAGGVGAGVDINLNGLQGKAVRLFRDDIPVDYLGRAFDISLLNSNTLDRIDVYKGVLPVSLGADAIGGGVNFLSLSAIDNVLNVSYDIASFGTHKFSLHSQYSFDTSGLYIGLSGQVNYAKNNYPVTVQATDFETGARTQVQVERFHDKAESYFGELKAGFRDLSWADNIFMSLVYTDFRKEFQHGSLMTTPLGEVEGREYGLIPSLRYIKKITADTKLDLFGTYSSLRTIFNDTSARKYNWFGQVEDIDTSSSESGSVKTQQNVEWTNGIARVNLLQVFEPWLNADLNYCYTYQSRIGVDAFGLKNVFTGIDPLTIRASYSRHVGGIEFTADLVPKELTAVAAGKFYSYEASGAPTAEYKSFDMNPILTVTNSLAGGSFALRYLPYDDILVRLSYERGVRLPDRLELFGDGTFILNNFDLRPEVSHNINLSVRYKNNDYFQTSISLFDRDLDDLIILKPGIPFSQYINFDGTYVKGVELSSVFSPLEVLKIGANVTLQDLRRSDIMLNTERYLEDSRIPNVPFFFCNADIHYTIRNLLLEDASCQFYYYWNYIHQFYLNSIPVSQEPKTLLGDANIDTDLIIPSQMTHTIGVSYVFPLRTWIASFEIENVTNERTFDNFKIEKPGRAFHLKIAYTFQDFFNYNQ